MNQAISWTLDVDIHPNQQDAFRVLMHEMVAATQEHEPGALYYEWNTTQDGAHCQIYERYQDSNAVMTHLANFQQSFAERFLQILTPTRLVLYGEPSDQVLQALEPYAPIHMRFAAGFSR